MKTRLSYILAMLFMCTGVSGKSFQTLGDYNVTWNTQSKNSSESMPCGGGETGLNVWAENNDILFYFSRSSCFDENNALLKLGRVRLHLSEAHFDKNFRQVLTLQDGTVRLYGSNNTVVTLWVDVFHPCLLYTSDAADD